QDGGQQWFFSTVFLVFPSLRFTCILYYWETWMKMDGIASWTTLIQSENKISKNSQLERKAEKRQQMRQAGQRLIFKWTAFFRGESGFRGQQHHSLGITTGLVRR
ncbi:unnamed protein product, partial [Porites lobata]